MTTADNVKSKIQGLINKSNETTGNADTDLTSAVNHLAEGYGSGSGGSADNGFNLAKINMTSDSGGTIEMLIGTFENAMTNPASLVLVLQDVLFFTYKGINFEPVAGIYECTTNTPAGQATLICTLSTDGTCTLEVVEGSSAESSNDGFILKNVNLGSFIEFLVKTHIEGEAMTGTLASVPTSITDYARIVLMCGFSDNADMVVALTCKGINMDEAAAIFEGDLIYNNARIRLSCNLGLDGAYSIKAAFAVDPSVTPTFIELVDGTITGEYTLSEDGKRIDIVLNNPEGNSSKLAAHEYLKTADGSLFALDVTKSHRVCEIIPGIQVTFSFINDTCIATKTSGGTFADYEITQLIDVLKGEVAVGYLKLSV